MENPNHLLKIVEKSLSKKNLIQALSALLQIFVQKPKEGHTVAYQRIYEKAGLYFAQILKDKKATPLVLQLIKGAPQESLIFIGHIAAEFGQLGGAIHLVTTAYPPLEMDLPLFNFLIDILDSFNERAWALELVLEYCKTHSGLKTGNVSANDIYLAAQKEETPVSAEAECTPLNASVVYTEEELKILELYFKLPKLAYVQGKLKLTLKFIETIRPAVLAGKDLHLTSVRNGNSYFGYLSTLLALNTKEETSELPLLYCVGDSHCLSLGFESLTLFNQSYWVKPELVTGCKIWHLRPTSRFHAKQNFERVTASLPEKAAVVFLFGEIDCREGMIKAVAKGLYSSIPAAIKVLLTIYFDHIEKIRKHKRLSLVCIHPVPPVLNETRAVVQIFNQMLAEKIALLNQKNSTSIFHYLDIDSQLLENGKLKSEFNLDGTHLNPTYKKLIESL